MFVHGVRTVCLVGAGFAVAALALVALVVRPARATEIDEFELEDDAAALAEHTAVELV